MSRSPTPVAPLETHYLFQQALYQPRWEDLGPFRFHWHPEIRDPEWNHIRPRPGIASLPPFATWPLATLRERFAALGRTPTVALFEGAGSGAPAAPERIRKALEMAGWQPVFRHRWLIWDGCPPGATEDPAAGYRVAPVTTAEDLEAFGDLFFEGFGFGGAEETPWRRALVRSAQVAIPAVTVRHYLAFWKEAPAGVATLCLHRTGATAVAGFYNLAVAPACRRRGVGTALAHHRLREAHAAGARWGFLQTESLAVEEWDQRRGFRPGGVMVGWSPSRD